MGISVFSAKLEANRARRYADELMDARNRLMNVKDSLNSAWQATEMRYVNLAIDSINQQLSRIASELDSLGSDITSVAYEIQREEEARLEREKQKQNKA